MEQLVFTKEKIEQLEIEFEKWQEFLNFVLGVFCFNTALACLGLKSPQLYGWLAVAFFLVSGAIGASKFPPTYKKLRDTKQRTPEEDIWFRGVRDRFLGLPAIFKNFPLYWMGLITLVCVAAGVFKDV